MRFVAEVFDEPLHVADGHAKRRAGLGHDIFLDHDAAEIVRAVFQRHLPDLQALRDPRALDVLEIIQINPRERLHPQILVRANRRRFQFRVFGLKCPRDERGKPFRFVLLRAQSFQMLDAVFNGLDVAEHHRRAGRESETMRHVHDFEPVVAHRLERRDALTHAIHQDFAAAAGNRTESGRLEIADDGFQRFVEHFAEMHEFARTETVDVEIGEFVFDVRQQIQIPLLGQLRMVPALHQHLRAAERDGLLDFFIEFGQRDDVGIVVLLHAIKRAELAIDIADVRVIHIAVDDVGDDVVAAAGEILRLRQLPATIRERAELFERQLIKPQRFGRIDAPAVPNSLEQFVQ